MNLTKKIIAFITICSLFFLNNFTYASINTNKENPYKQELLSIKNGLKYKNQINKFITKLDEKNSIKILKKLDRINKKLVNKNDSKSKKLKIILNYLVVEIQNKLNNDLSTETIKTNISDKDKKYAENEIIKIQSSLLNNSKNLIEKLSTDFNKLTKYEEKGNLKINLDLDYDEIGTLKSQAELKNYVVKNNLLDSSFNTEFNVNIDSKLKHDIEKKLKINSKIDYINKDGLEYLLVDEFKVLNNKGFESFKEYLDTFTKLAKENNYIEIENNKINQNLLKNIRKINPKKIIADYQNILSQPFLEAYNKTGDKYYLKPTRYTCDKIKELSNKFDPINGKKCSNSQYNDLLEEVTKYGNLYLNINKEKKELIYEYKKTTKLDSGIISIKFDNENIKSIFIDIIPNQKRFVDEGFKFNYTSKENLDIWFNADKGTKYLSLQSKLSNFNSFKSIELTIKSKGKRDEFKLDYKLGNSKINGNIDYIINSYNWKSDKYTQSNVFNANISGTRNNWKLSMNNKDIKNQTNTLTSNLRYINGNLSGITNINKKDKTNILKINHNGKIDINYFELNNKITFSKDFTKNIIKINEKNKQTDYNLEENIDLIIDNKNNKNNFYLLINALLNTKEILKFELINTSKKTYKNIKIQKPLNTIKLEDISK